MKVELMPVDQVIPYARNPRINAHAIEKVAASIKEFGFRQPIVTDKELVIVVGHVRFEAAKRSVLRLITVPLTNSQFDALVSFTFNLGGGALQRSTLRRKVNREEHDDVPAEFLRWVWAGGKKLRGLVRRREAELLLYQSVY